MNDDHYLSTLNEISSNLNYLKTTLEILKAAHVLSVNDFDDIDPKTNLLRVSLLIETYIARLECPYDELTNILKYEFNCLTSSKTKCCSSSNLSKSE